MIFIWSWLYFITAASGQGKTIQINELYRILRFFYIRYNNFNRSVTTLKKTLDLILINGIWDSLDNEMGNEIENPEEETDTKFRTKEETIKNTFLQLKSTGNDLFKIEELIWQIEDHPLNLDGSDVGNLNITHLIDLNDSTTIEKLTDVSDSFFGLFPNGSKSPSDSATLNTVFLHYGDFYRSKGYSNGNKYDFSDWKRNIRKDEFKKLIGVLIEKSLSEHLVELNQKFIIAQKEVIKDSQIALSKGFNIREKLIFYSMLLKPQVIWQYGNIIIEYGQVNSSRLFKDEDKLIYNLKSDFRSSYVDLWEEIKKLYENPLDELKKLLE